MEISTAEWSIVQSIYTVGGFCGALILGGSHASKLGRIQAMQCIAGILMLGSLVESGAWFPSMLAAGRLLSGIGAGAATVVCPVFLATIAPKAKRGLFGSFTQVMINFGIFLGLVVGSFFGKNGQWKFALAAGAIPALLTLIGLTFAQDAATIAVQSNLDISPAANEEQPLLAPPTFLRRRRTGDVITQSTKSETKVIEVKTSVSFTDVVCDQSYRKAVVAVVIAMMAQQLTGINSLSFYSVNILGSVSPSNAEFISIFVAAINVLATALLSFLPDVIGRKPCLLLSTGGVATSCVLLVLGLSASMTVILVPALLLFVCSFSAGLGTVPFMLASELVGPEAVGAVSSWGLGANWISSFIVAQFFPLINGALVPGHVFWIFAAIAVFFGCLIWWCVPESKGKTDLDEIWGTVATSRDIPIVVIRDV